MYQRILFGAFITLIDAASATNLRHICDVNSPNFTASQQKRYIIEPPAEDHPAETCCKTIVTAEAEAPLLLLEMLRPSTAACADATADASQAGELVALLDHKLVLSRAQLCKEPLVRHIWAAGGTRVCFLRNPNEPGADGTARLLAFSAVAARSVCETSVFPNSLLAASVRPEYVFAQDKQLTNFLPGATPCNATEDYLLAIYPENASASAIRVEVLASPGDISCRSLFVQGVSVRDGECFAITAGSQLTIAYNRSSPCNSVVSVSFALRLQYYDDSNLSSADSDIGATVHRRSSEVLLISLCATAAVLLTISVVAAVCARRTLRRKCRRRQQPLEIIDMHDNELYEAARLKS